MTRRARKAIALALLIAGLAAGAALGWKLASRDVRQSVDSPDARHRARLFMLYDEGGPAPYGQEVTLAAAADPLGRLTGKTLWIGYCANGRLSWRSAAELELSCPPHPDAKDVYVGPAVDGISLRVQRRK
jgi:hypothetical protein